MTLYPRIKFHKLSFGDDESRLSPLPMIATQRTPLEKVPIVHEHRCAYNSRWVFLSIHSADQNANVQPNVLEFIEDQTSTYVRKNMIYKNVLSRMEDALSKGQITKPKSSPKGVSTKVRMEIPKSSFIAPQSINSQPEPTPASHFPVPSRAPPSDSQSPAQSAPSAPLQQEIRN